jgi:hypothetical protein
VPNVSAGDWPLTVQGGGQTLTQTVYIATR